MSALSMVKKQFPQVEEVVDATEGVRVRVQKRDSHEGRKKQPNDCALARACRREMKADGAIINVAFSYVIKGKTATRYMTSTAVAREITSFDRHQDFAAGDDYLLSKVPPAARLGIEKRRGRSGSHTPKKSHLAVHQHKTEDIRVSSR
jgi:hypothetical protein